VALDTETMQRIMLDVDLGIPADESTVPPSPEADAFRAKMVQQVAAIKAAGKMVHFTAELVDLGPPPERPKPLQEGTT
jgi:hypothetical protein